MGQGASWDEPANITWTVDEVQEFLKERGVLESSDTLTEFLNE